MLLVAACERAPATGVSAPPAARLQPALKVEVRHGAPDLVLESPISSRAQVRLETERARSRVVALLEAVEPFAPTSPMASRLDLARTQLDTALELLEDAAANRDQRDTITRRALLSLRAAPLSLSLFAMDVPLAVRWKQLSPEIAERLSQEAREVRRLIEQTSAGAERVLGKS